MKEKLTPRKLEKWELNRLKKLWQRSTDINIVYDRYDMNFVLNLLALNTDLIEQSLGLTKKKKVIP